MTAKRAPGDDKVGRILDATRAGIAEWGAAGATVERVSERAGVSRGSLHYYFGSKERLLVEAIRRDGERRGAFLAEALADCDSADAVVAVLLAKLEENLRDDSFFRVLFELSCEGQRAPAVRERLAASFDDLLERVGGALDAKRREGVLGFEGDPLVVARTLYAMAAGYALQILNDPDGDHGATLAGGAALAASLLRGKP